ncbi:RNA polymerase sigma factor [Thermomonospora umbrina]|uniref:DNA-directed RNA polymerase specialized sigma24 family protein n=1 Tax=Thermomonospora umbrina TaxID=111806 RepID=A0A3D9T295_9ACTN|nr:RNA polymerase sigma factor [Thermomonospora umbrina]REE98884.1 DNA-directed RNA polymerase specialized sigma24 family protein [Thermomonospora umbrina]
MPGTPEALYDAHAVRLHTYCWSLVGDGPQGAEAAVRDAFVAAVRHPPRGDAVLWLYALARSACMDHGALDRAFAPASGRHADPLLRVAAGLRADHREVLVLSAGEWLNVRDIAAVLDIAADTALQLLQAARTRLEHGVLDLLMREPGSPYADEIIAAFEKGDLPRLLARRAPDRPPAELRDEVLAACAAELDRALPSVTVTAPLVVIGSPATGRGARDRRRPRGLGAVAGLAASAAAAIGMIAAWAGAKGGGENDLTALSPTSGFGSESVSGTPAATRSLITPSPSVSKGTGSDASDTSDPQTATSSPYAPGPPRSAVPPPRSRWAPTPDPGDDPKDERPARPDPDPSSPTPTPDRRSPSPTPEPPTPGPTSPGPDGPATPTPTPTPSDPGPEPTEPRPSPTANPSPTSGS